MTFNNEMKPLPKLGQAGDIPEVIRHYILQIEPDGNDIKFTRKKVPNTNPPSEIAAYVKTALGNRPKSVDLTGSPYDLPSTKNCLMVVELDSTKKGWQFEAGHVAVTLKKSGGSELYGLHHVDKNGVASEDLPADGCVLIYFGVGKRESTKTYDINLHTEFKRGDKTLKIIIDPDVPNTGDGDDPPLNPPVPPQD